MIDRRLEFIQNLESFLLKQNADWAGPLQFEEPPATDQTQNFDLAIPCFSLSKIRKEAPQKCAENISSQLMEVTIKEKLGIELTAVVKGFLNIRFSADILAKSALERIEEPLRSSAKALAKEKIVIDYSSPNIAKPFGIGHLRSTNIGGALCRILTSLGAQVIRINHLGDWGTQFGKMITAYKRFGSAEFVRGDPVNNLYKLYVEFHEREKDDPALLDEAREWFVKLEKGDPEALELWKWFKDVSYHEFKRLYDRLGVDFDYVTGESFYNQLMEKTAERLETAKLLKKSEGAMIVDLEEFGMPPVLIRKSDGSTLYATRDLATAEYRAKTFSPTKIVYVVGGEQTLHFRQVFKVLEMLGYDWAKNCVHVGFGLIKFPEGKMSTRKGNIVLLEQVLDQSEKEALKIVQEKNKEKPEERRLTENEEFDIARAVGTGAVIFFDLHAKRTKDILFNWKDILNFEGDSGPYLQYTHVRLESLIERAKNEGIKFDDKTPLSLEVPEERELIRRLLGFPAMVEAAAREFEPSMISHELLDIAASFNRFYMNVSILKGEEKYKASRIQLVRFTQRVMQTGLGLLGIECPKKM
ncbi:MAG: arginine--tRNA ligase [Deltaproteobacteria bacterium]|nr:arginine--tRNA ligase [Deltaproteobacteria bacterium]